MSDDTFNFADQLNDIMTGLQNMRKATDGHHTIVATSILDQHLERALLTKMRPLNAKTRERLFDRALHFAGKIDLAFALSVIDEEFYDALRVKIKFVSPSPTRQKYKTSAIQKLPS